MRATGELAGDFSYSVTLNGDDLLSGDVNETTIDESRSAEVEIAELLVDRANRLIMERARPTGDQSGEGQLYYTAHLRYFLPVAEVKALDRGIVVARQYTAIDAPETYVTQAQVGDVIRVKLTIVAPTDLYYVAIEDPLPAGFEAVDVTLNTTSVVGEAPTVRNVTAEDEDSWYRWYGWGWWWFSHSEMRDEKVTLFSSYLPRGTYEYTYVMRATVPGTYQRHPDDGLRDVLPGGLRAQCRHDVHGDRGLSAPVTPLSIIPTGLRDPVADGPPFCGHRSLPGSVCLVADWLTRSG